MPLYGFECSCGKTRDEFRSIAARNDPLNCECGKPMERVIGGYAVVPDLQPYYDENLDTYIRSKQHRREVMREQGVMEKFGMNWNTSAKNRARAR